MIKYMNSCSYEVVEFMKFLIEGMNCPECVEDLKLHKKQVAGIKNIKSDGDNIIVEANEDITADEILNNILSHLKHVGHNHSNLKIYEDETVFLKGLTCANCTLKIEDATRKIPGVRDAKYDFRTERYSVIHDSSNSFENIFSDIEKIVDRIEPDVKVVRDEKHIRNEGKHEQNCSYCSVDTDVLKGIKDENKEHEHSHAHHGHSHEISLSEGESEETSSLKKNSVKYIAITAILVALHFMNPGKFAEIDVKVFIYLILYIIAARKVLISAFKNMKSGEFLDENFLMTIASIGAFAVGEYPEAVVVMLLYDIGEDVEDLALQKSRKSISAALALKPKFANLIKDGNVVKVSPEKVNPGDIILVKPGEKVPLDGIIIEGESYVNTAEITGESVPRKIKVNDEVYSGFINNEAALKVRVTSTFDDSTISKILDLVENASARKAPIDRFITKFAKVYTPAVVGFAALMLIIPPLMGWLDFKDALFRACTFLVISCPCALVISVPLGIFSGIGLSSKNGIFVEGGNYLEAMAELSDVVFDKTGTVTKGVFEVTDIQSASVSGDELLKLAAYGEYNSTHPIGKAVLKAYNGNIDFNLIKDFREISGKGVSYYIGEDFILAGNLKLLNEYSINCLEYKGIGTAVYIARNSEFLGTIIVSDVLKDNIKNDLERLKSLGITLTMLSGDNTPAVKAVAKSAGIDNAYGNLMPAEKVSRLEEIISHAKGRVAFVGDGVNDAPVIARADVGFAMGGIGSDSALEAADVVLMTDEISKVSEAIEISRYTKKTVMGNIVFALGVKFAVLLLGALGYASMWAAVFADVGVTIICILNSIRILNRKI